MADPRVHLPCVRAPGSPDFATSSSSTCPTGCAWKLKSLKLYIWSFRDRGAYHEAVTNEIADHLQATLQGGASCG